MSFGDEDLEYEEQAPTPVEMRFPTGIGRETRKVDLFNLDAAAIQYGIRALAREGRFGGLLPGRGVTYNVLLHSVVVGDIVGILGGSPAAMCGGLVHDLHEGFGLRDIPSPIKRYMRSAQEYAYDDLCAVVDDQVNVLLGIPTQTWEDDDVVARADKLALLIEQDYFQDTRHFESLETFGFTREEYVQSAAVFQMVRTIGGVAHEDLMVELFNDMLDSNLRIARGEASMETEASRFHAIADAVLATRPTEPNTLS